MKKGFVISLMIVFGLNLSACNKEMDDEEITEASELNMFMDDRLAVKQDNEWGYVNEAEM